MPELIRHNRRDNFHSAVQFGDTLYLTGLVAKDRTAGMYGQAKQLLERLGEVLEEYGSDRRQVLHCTCYVTDLRLKDEMDQAWREFFGDDLPARATVEVSKLGADALLEVSTIAAALK